MEASGITSNVKHILGRGVEDSVHLLLQIDLAQEGFLGHVVAKNDSIVLADIEDVAKRIELVNPFVLVNLVAVFVIDAFVGLVVVGVAGYVESDIVHVRVFRARDLFVGFLVDVIDRATLIGVRNVK